MYSIQELSILLAIRGLRNSKSRSGHPSVVSKDLTDNKALRVRNSPIFNSHMYLEFQSVCSLEDY